MQYPKPPSHGLLDTQTRRARRSAVSFVTLLGLSMLAGITVVPGAQAAPFCDMEYNDGNDIVPGSTFTGGQTIVAFSVVTPTTPGDRLTLVFPAGTSLAGLVAADFRVQQLDEASGDCWSLVPVDGLAAAPLAITVAPATRTLTFTPSAESYTSEGWGTWVLTYAGSAGKIVHDPCPSVATATATARDAWGDTGSHTLPYTIIPLDTASPLSATPTSLPVGDTADVEATLFDQNGCILDNLDVELTSSRGATDTIGPTATVATDATGKVTWTITSSTAGIATITAEVKDAPTGLLGTNPVVEFTDVCTPGAVSPGSLVSASPASVAADGASASTITVTLTDGSCANGIPGKTVSIASDRGALDQIVPATAITDSYGTASFSITSNTVGTATITAMDETDGIQLTTEPTVDFVSLDLGPLSWVVDPTDTGMALPFAEPVAVRAWQSDGVTGFSGIVELELVGGPADARLLNGPGQETGATTPRAQTDARGIAIFPGLAVSKPGTDYRLRAQVGATTVQSVPFDVGITGPSWPMFHQNGARTGRIAGQADFAGGPTLAEMAAFTGAGTSIVDSPVVTDLNGDGRLDLVVVNSFTNNAGANQVVRAYRQDNSGNLVSYWSRTINDLWPGPVGGTPPPLPSDALASIAADDLDGDGRAEVAVFVNAQLRTWASYANLYVLDGTTGQNRGTPVDLEWSCLDTRPIAIADVNGNGEKEILVMHNDGTCSQTFVAGIRFTAGPDTLTKLFDQTYPTTRAEAAPLAVAEIDPSHDGMEIIVGTSNGATASSLHICLATPMGAGMVPNALNCGTTASSTGIATRNGINGIAVRDLNADGLRDIVTNGEGSEFAPGLGAGPPSLETFYMDGSLTAGPTFSDRYLGNTPTLADIDGDQRADIVNVGFNGACCPASPPSNDGDITVRGINAATMLSKGTWARPPAPLDTGTAAGGLLVDASNDGVPEFFVGSPIGEIVAANVRDVAGPPNPSPVSWGPVVTTGTPSSPPVAGDLTGDCRPEVVVGQSTGHIAILGGQAATAPQAPTFGPSTGGTDYMLVASWGGGTSPGAGLQAKLAWNRAADDGGLPVVAYHIYRVTGLPDNAGDNGATDATYRSNLVGVWPSGTPPTMASPFIDDVGVAGDYYYKVAAVTCYTLAQEAFGTGDGAGPLSEAFYSEVRFPDPPTGLQAAISKGEGPAYPAALEARLDWTAAAQNYARPHGCGAVDAYRIYRATFPDSIDYGAPLGVASVSPYTDDTVVPGQIYHYHVRAVNCVGEELVGDQEDLDTRLPAPVTALTAQASGMPAYEDATGGSTESISVALSFTPPAEVRACGWLEGYRVERNLDGGAFSTIATVTPDGMDVTWPKADAPTDPAVASLGTWRDLDASLARGHIYEYRVSPVNCAGVAVASTSAADTRVPGQPTLQLTVQQVPKEVALEWTPHADTNGCDAIEGYRIYRGTESGSLSLWREIHDAGSGPAAWKTQPVTTPGPIVTSTVDDTVPGTTYYYQVSAINCVGESQRSDEQEAIFNQPPVHKIAGISLAGGESLSVDEDTTLAFTGDALLTVTDADEGAHGNTETQVSIPAGMGVLSMDTSGVTVDAATDTTIKIIGTLTAINAALATLEYAPHPDACPSDVQFTIETDDRGNQAAAGTGIVATDLIRIDVDCLNDAPVAYDNGTIGLDEDDSVDITLEADDVEDDPLTYTVSTANNGVVDLLADNVYTYTPSADFCGADSFTFYVNDGDLDSNTATVDLLVACINDAPIVPDLDLSTDEEEPLDITLTLAETDPDGASPTFSIVSNPTYGGISGLIGAGAITYTPDAAYCDEDTPDSFTYKANDGMDDSNIGTIRVTVSCINDAPVAIDQDLETIEDTDLEITLSATDEEGDALDFVIDDGPDFGIITGKAGDSDPTFIYVPDLDYCDEDTPDAFTFTVDDGNGGTDTGTVTITVTCAPDGPRATGQTISVDEDGSIDLTLVATDTEGDPLTYEIHTAPLHGTLTELGGAGGNETTYTPDGDYCGPDAFRFNATDGGLASNNALVTITVDCVNDAPVAKDQTFDIDEDGDLVGVLDITDVDDDAWDLTDLSFTAPSWFSWDFSSAPAFVTAPNAHECGTYSFDWTMSDSGGLDASATLTVNVACINDAPIAFDQTLPPSEEDEVLEITLGASDVETAAEDLNYAIIVAPEQGSAILDANTVTFTPEPQSCGTFAFSFQVDDGELSSNIAEVIITIECATDRPTAKNLVGTLDEDDTLEVTLDATDPEGDTLTYTIVQAPTNGTAVQTLAGQAATVYTPRDDWCGQDEFRYQANDATTQSNIAKVTITVACINDPPTFTPVAQWVSDEDAPVDSPLYSNVGPGGGEDEEGQDIAFQLTQVAGPGDLFSVAPVVASDGRITYVPAPDACGEALYQVSLNETETGLGSGIEELSIDILCINDAPTIVLDETDLVLDEGTALSDVPMAAISTGPAPEADQSVTMIDVAFSAPQSLLDAHGVAEAYQLFQPGVTLAIDGNLTLIPIPGVCTRGEEAIEVTWTAVDDGDTGHPDDQSVSDPAVLTVRYTCHNEPPTFGVPDSITLMEGAPYASHAFISSLSLGQGREAYEQGIKAVHLGVDDPSLFALQPILDWPGSGFDRGDEAAGLAFLAHKDACGSTTVTIAIEDDGTDPGTAMSSVHEVPVSITCINDAPTADVRAIHVQEDDGAGGALVALLAVNLTSGGGIFEGAQAVVGSVAFDANKIVTGQPQVEGTSLACPDGEICTGSSDGLLLSFALVKDACGVARGVLTLEDDGGILYGGVNKSTFPFEVRVACVNDPPMVHGLRSEHALVVPEPLAPVSVPAWYASTSPGPSNEVGQDVQLDVSALDATLFDALPVLDGKTLRFTPGQDVYGPVQVQVCPVDDGPGDWPHVREGPCQIATILLLNKNEAPTFVPPPLGGRDRVVDEDSGFHTSQWATDLTTGGNDGPQMLSFHVEVDDPALFSVQPSIGRTGILTFATAQDATGTATASVWLQDDGGTLAGGVDRSGTVTFSITIVPRNDGPVAMTDSYVMAEDTTLDVGAPGFLANDFDVDGDTLNVRLLTGVSHGVLNWSPSGAFVYTPAADRFGMDSFTYEIEDVAGAKSAGLVRIEVINVGDVPLTLGDYYVVTPGQRLWVEDSFGILQNDIDIDGDALQAHLVRGPSQGTLRLSPGGGFDYMPDPGASGTDSFTYFPTDSLGLKGAVRTVELRITDNLLPEPIIVIDRERIHVGDSVTLRDIGSDPDGLALGTADSAEAHDSGTLRRTWDFGDGTSAGGKTQTHQWFAPGVYTVRLSVMDERLGETVATREVIVLPPGGGRLSVDAGEAQVRNHPYGVELVGTVKAGTPLQYAWTQVSGPSAHLFDADTPHASFTVPALPAGDHETDAVFRFAAFDGEVWVHDDVVVTMRAPGIDPKVRVPGPLATEVGSSVDLDAQATGFGVLEPRLAWRQVEGPPVGLNDNATGSSVTVHIPAHVAGETLVFEVRATAADVGTQWERVEVQVAERPFQSNAGDSSGDHPIVSSLPDDGAGMGMLAVVAGMVIASLVVVGGVSLFIRRR